MNEEVQTLIEELSGHIKKVIVEEPSMDKNIEISEMTKALASLIIANASTL